MAAPGLQIGRVLGVPVWLAPSWFLFGGFIVLSNGPVLAQRFGPLTGYAAATAIALGLLVSIVLHEVGHCVVARMFGLPVRSITVTLLAGLTEITRQPQTPAREFAVAAAGPAVSLVLAVGLFVAAVPLEDGTLVRFLVRGLALTNAVVAVFNLLPGLPLDGGRVLRAAIWGATGDSGRATVVSAWLGRAVAVLVVPLLVLVALPALGSRASLTTVLFGGLVSAFILAGASGALQQARLQAALPRQPARELARPALAVAGDLPLAEAVRRAQAAGVHALVVVDSSGLARAVVNEAAVVAVPEPRRPWVAVATVARSVQDGLVLDPDLAGQELLDALRAVPASEYVVPEAVPGRYRVLVTQDVLGAVGRAGAGRGGGTPATTLPRP